ncbi:MAG: hypothetical protein IK093_13865 [Ruminiclostridium sp.]|nr:hypothetical protein [Ruminiclostridium sp.]
MKTFLEEKAKTDGELTPEELEQAAGGSVAERIGWNALYSICYLFFCANAAPAIDNERTANEAFWSTFTAGIICAATAAVSAYTGSTNMTGERGDNDGRLCNTQIEPVSLEEGETN